VSIDFQKKTVVPEHVLFRELEGESVLLNIDTETYFGLDDVGTRMWNLLAAGGSIQTAYDALLEEYDADPQTLKEDLADIINQLREKGLIQIEDPQP
jgi:hypothetical protein